MHPTIRLWIDELRSGKWKQGRAVLRDNKDRVCCLGVLCEILPDPPERSLDAGDYSYIYTYKADNEEINFHRVPPTKLTDSLGIERTVVTRCYLMNDTHGKSFNEIADYLENLYGDASGTVDSSPAVG